MKMRKAKKTKINNDDDDEIDTISFLNKHKKEISQLLFSFSENDFLKMTNFSEF